MSPDTDLVGLHMHYIIWDPVVSQPTVKLVHIPMSFTVHYSIRDHVELPQYPCTTSVSPYVLYSIRDPMGLPLYSFTVHYSIRDLPQYHWTSSASPLLYYGSPVYN